MIGAPPRMLIGCHFEQEITYARVGKRIIRLNSRDIAGGRNSFRLRSSTAEVALLGTGRPMRHNHALLARSDEGRHCLHFYADHRVTF